METDSKVIKPVREPNNHHILKPHIPPNKIDIARCYEISSKSLANLIKAHITRFEKIGYNKNRHFLTPKERELLRELIGDPYLTT